MCMGQKKKKKKTLKDESNTTEQKHWTMALIEVTFSWLWVPTVCEIICSEISQKYNNTFICQADCFELKINVWTNCKRDQFVNRLPVYKLAIHFLNFQLYKVKQSHLETTLNS